MKIESGLPTIGAKRGACGVGALIDLNGTKTHQLVEDGLRILCNIDHRGARGAEEKTGDGAGMLLQKPHEFLIRKFRRSATSIRTALGNCSCRRINGSRSL